MMKHTLLMIVTIILFASGLACKAQTIISSEQIKHFEKKSDSLKKVQQFESAIHERLEINKIESSYISNLYELAALYSIARNNDSAFLYLGRAAALDSTINFLVNPDFLFICNDDRWAEIQHCQVAEYELIHGNFKNLPLATLLWKMKMKDQSYYVFIDYTKKDDANNYWKIKDSINKNNLLVLDSIIQKNGWPKKSKVGKEGSSAAFLIIQHADYSTQKRYSHLLKKAVKQKEANPQQLAMLTDRIKLHENKKQIYGSQIDWDPVTQKEFFNYRTLKNPSKVNKRRKKVGLGPIEEYVKIWNITWEYKK